MKKYLSKLILLIVSFVNSTGLYAHKNKCVIYLNDYKTNKTFNCDSTDAEKIFLLLEDSGVEFENNNFYEEQQEISFDCINCHPLNDDNVNTILASWNVLSGTSR